MQFNASKFLENVQKIHITKPEEMRIYEGISDAEVRARLGTFIDGDKKPGISQALDEICENLVGRTMFEVLITKLQSSKKRMCIREHKKPNHGSYYNYKEYAVYVNLSFYKKDGTGIPSRLYTPSP